MRIEEEVFAQHKLIPDKLIDYGFKTENDRLAYSRELPDDGMKIIVEYDGAKKCADIRLQRRSIDVHFQSEQHLQGLCLLSVFEYGGFFGHYVAGKPEK